MPPDTDTTLSRRALLGGGLAAAAGLILPATAQDRSQAASHLAAPSAAPPSAAAADFTFVHLTDMHVTPKRKGDRGYQACVEHVRSLRPQPAFVLTGGDLAFDGNYTPKAEFEEQIRLYREISRGFGVPVHHCMGNHDALGFSARRKCAPDDPEIGKKMIMDRLEWEQSYYSFDHHGWHFAVLDCIHPIDRDGPTYEPRIGPEQLEWLAHDLGRAGDRPKVCVTHIAAFCAMAQYNGDPERKALDGSMVLWDTKALREVLERHHVLALLQGHSHRREAYQFRGVWYLTSAAVSGAWWAGDWIGEGPGYTLLHCRGGKLTWEHQTFAWAPHLEPEDVLERKKLEEWHAYEQQQRDLREKERA